MTAGVQCPDNDASAPALHDIALTPIRHPMSCAPGEKVNNLHNTEIVKENKDNMGEA